MISVLYERSQPDAGMSLFSVPCIHALHNQHITTAPSSPLRGSDAANNAAPLVLDVSSPSYP